MKILTLMYYDEMLHGTKSFKEVAALSAPVNKEYCKTHGYDFITKENDFDFSRRIGWERINLFLKYIDSYDWMWFLGADCMVMNHTIKLENIIDDHYDMIISRTYHNPAQIEVNTDSWLVKCSDWSKNFLQKINSNIPMFHHVWSEQQAVINELKDEEQRRHFKLVHSRHFNSYYHAWYPEHNFQFGDFVIQAAGHGNDYRVELFNELQHKIIRIPQHTIQTPLKI